MSILQAMFSGSSALINFGEAMTVIGNNLANANTTSFKSSSTAFQDVLIQTVGTQGSGASTQVGTGVGLGAISQDMTQGSFTPSASVTDLSIDGKGFFMVKDISLSADGEVDQSGKPLDIFYSRDGGFKRDVNGDLINSGGLVLQGWELDEDGNQVAGGTDDINFTKFNVADPTPTTLVEASLILDAGVTAKDVNTVYNPNDPTTYDFSTSVRVFDSRGSGHNVELQFTKLPMAVAATVVGQNGNNTIGMDLSEEANVTLTFTPIGGGTAITADAVTLPAGNNQVDLTTLTSGTATQPILDQDVRYKISYDVTPTDATSTATTILTGMTGDDGTAEIVGEDSDNIWTWHMVVQTDELDQAQQGTGTLTALDLDSDNVKAAATNAGYTTGRLEFDSKGKLMNEGSTPITVTFAGAETQEILFDFGDAIGTNGDATNDFNKATLDLIYEDAVVVSDTGNTGGLGTKAQNLDFTSNSLKQNGFTAGFLDQLSVSADGTISASYTNNQTKDLFQISLVDFRDEGALEQVGANLFAETLGSGIPLVGAAETGRLGSVVSFSLEQSNVDMSTEFVRMITIQRGFQANSRIVTVTDGMLEELISLKR
ncbi:MAG: flagellar hook-basal body complex protein [Magnetococcales bacterium]|nr:flagellar hook-basal body complex protein [Magnetococcales bacterium]